MSRADMTDAFGGEFKAAPSDGCLPKVSGIHKADGQANTKS